MYLSVPICKIYYENLVQSSVSVCFKFRNKTKDLEPKTAIITAYLSLDNEHNEISINFLFNDLLYK